MRRSRFVPYTLLLLTLVSLPVAARTSPLLSASEDVAVCPENGATIDDQAAVANKPASAKRGAAPSTTKARPGARGGDTAPGRAPRWHRFLPGMYR